MIPAEGEETLGFGKVLRIIRCSDMQGVATQCAEAGCHIRVGMSAEEPDEQGEHDAAGPPCNPLAIAMPFDREARANDNVRKALFQWLEQCGDFLCEMLTIS